MERYDEALAHVREVQKPSPSYLQRTMLIPYGEAVALIERMEIEGICTKANHAGIRRMVAPIV